MIPFENIEETHSLPFPSAVCRELGLSESHFFDSEKYCCVVCSHMFLAFIHSCNLRVMPLTRFVADAFGVVTICLVALLILLGLLCILCSLYCRFRIRCQGFIRLSYFSGPWIVRILFILISIWWGFGEIIRLSLLRREGRVLNALDLDLQEIVCKCYVVSNLGFAEPCLFLILVFLLRASIKNMESGTLNRKWNGKTTGLVLLFCLPIFLLQLFVILIAPRLSYLPHYFTTISYAAAASKTKTHHQIALCTYPLLSTILVGIFVTVLTAYIFWLGRRILNLVINKGLQKRVYTLIFSVLGFLPIRVLLLGLSVQSKPDHFLFEALVFLAFLALLCIAGVSTCLLVYCPVADSLALRNLHDLEAGRRICDEYDDIIYFMSNQSLSLGRNSNDVSTKQGLISFRTWGNDETSIDKFAELSCFMDPNEQTRTYNSW